MLVDLIKQYLQKRDTLTPTMKQSLKNFFDVKYTYNTNAIEGTTLSEQQTVEVLKWNVVEWHPLKEHLEVINHQKAWNKVAQLAWLWQQQKPKWLDIWSEDVILDLHKTILQGIDDINAWKYRNVNVRIAFSRAVLPRWEKVPDLMQKFVVSYAERFESLDLQDIEEVLKYGYDLHLDFVKIHPFVDGNGRLARLLMNMWFVWNWDVINVVFYKNRKEYRKEYIQSIEKADEDRRNYYQVMDGNFEEFLSQVLDLINQNIYFKL